MFDRPQKSVIRGPFRVFPRPAWFIDNDRALAVGPKLTYFNADPSLARLPGPDLGQCVRLAVATRQQGFVSALGLGLTCHLEAGGVPARLLELAERVLAPSCPARWSTTCSNPAASKAWAARSERLPDRQPSTSLLSFGNTAATTDMKSPLGRMPEGVACSSGMLYAPTACPSSNSGIERTSR